MISRFNGAIAGVVVHVHAPMIPHVAAVVSRFSDVNVKRATIELVGYAGDLCGSGEHHDTAPLSQPFLAVDRCEGHLCLEGPGTGLACSSRDGGS